MTMKFELGLDDINSRVWHRNRASYTSRHPALLIQSRSFSRSLDCDVAMNNFFPPGYSFITRHTCSVRCRSPNIPIPLHPLIHPYKPLLCIVKVFLLDSL